MSSEPGLTGEEQCTYISCGFQVAGRITEHQDVVFRIPVFRRYREMFRFCAHLLSGDQSNVGIDFVFSPFPYECLIRCRGYNNNIRFALKPLQGFAHSGKWWEVINNFRDTFVNTEAPLHNSAEFVESLAGSVVDCGL